MKKTGIALLLMAGQIYAQNVITSVSPDQADPGTSGITVTFTLPNSTPPTPPVNVNPTSAMLGSISGSSIVRVSLDTVTAVFSIPGGETEGLKDAVVTFPSPQGEIDFTLANGFTVGTATNIVGVYNGPPSEGYNLFSPQGSTTTYLMDNDENMIQSWSSAYSPGLSVYLLDDGSLLRTAATETSGFDSGGRAGRIEQYDWYGDLLWAFDYDSSDYRSHHDVEVLPNGNILMIAWEKKTQVEAEAAGRNPALLTDGELWPDHIIEVEPTGDSGGVIVWEWHVWDHLIQDYDASKPNFGTVADHPEKINLNYVQNGGADWNHVNAIDYNPDLGHILLSSRSFSEIWVIDHNTTTAEAAGSAGDLLYRWGNPATYDSGGSSNQQLFVQHDAQWIKEDLPGEGNILVFNNGSGRLDGDYSSVVEIVPPLALDGSYTNGLPSAPVWIYTNSVATNFYAQRISGAQRLPNGNTLICEGTESYAFEVTSAGALVWDYTGTNNMFRFERYAPDFEGLQFTDLALPVTSYTVVDTGQDLFYDESSEISEPADTDAFYGQDASYAGNQPKYQISPDGLTVYDYNTKLTWTKSADKNRDGTIDVNDKLTQADAAAYAATLNAENFGGYNDWRLPSIKEIYSLMDFRGTDPMSDDTSSLIPFIETNVFDVAYGDVDEGERTIDAQWATTTIYEDTVMTGQQAMFGLNLADGRIKGYPLTSDFYVFYVRGNTNYAVNSFADNGDGTVTDEATGLMWQQADSGTGMLWSNALDYAETNSYAGYDDWRLPNAKELHSIFDYSRSPGTTASAAIDPVFSCTVITNEGGQLDFPWYITSTTHRRQDLTGSSAVYLCFGRATGYMNTSWLDVHGAGAQRSDSKAVDLTGYTYVSDGWYFTLSPQGDAARWTNFVRLVRDVPLDSDGDGITNDEERDAYGTHPYFSDTDGDGADDGDEVVAGTDGTDDESYLFLGVSSVTSDEISFYWPSATSRTYRVQWSTNLNEDSWTTLRTQGSTIPTNTLNITPDGQYDQRYYRVIVEDAPYINN